MSIAPMPVAPPQRFVSAFDAVASREGVTVSVDRKRNVCRWSVYTRTAAGKPVTVSGPRKGQEWNPSNRQLAAQIVAAIESVCAVPGQVFVSDRATADVLREKSDLAISNLSPPAEAVAATREALTTVEENIIKGLILACDASRGRRTDINGCGWVLSYPCGADPVVGSNTEVASHGGIKAGELSAIRHGLQKTVARHPALRQGSGSLTVLTDSREALRAIALVRTESTPTLNLDSDSLDECRRILGLAAGVNVSFEWVRGHSGHELNEVADRLAVMARRNREMDVDDITDRRMLAAIREEVREAARASATGGLRS